MTDGRNEEKRKQKKVLVEILAKGTLRIAALFAPICILDASISLQKNRCHSLQQGSEQGQHANATGHSARPAADARSRDAQCSPAVSGVQGMGAAGVGPHERERDLAVRALLQAQLPLAAGEAQALLRESCREVQTVHGTGKWFGV